jgi:hypothetical protein
VTSAQLCTGCRVRPASPLTVSGDRCLECQAVAFGSPALDGNPAPSYPTPAYAPTSYPWAGRTLRCGHLESADLGPTHSVERCALSAELTDRTTRIVTIEVLQRGKGDARRARVIKREPLEGPHQVVVYVQHRPELAADYDHADRPWVVTTSGCDEVTCWESYASALGAALDHQAGWARVQLVDRAELDAEAPGGHFSAPRLEHP